MAARGSLELLNAIRSGAKKVSESNGISPPESKIPEVSVQGGAAYSMQRMQQASLSQPIPSPTLNVPAVEVYPQKIKNFDFEKSLNSRIVESLETLSSSKEYFNALQSLITLYAIGGLTEGVMRKITNEDLNELKGILNEFKSILDSF